MDRGMNMIRAGQDNIVQAGHMYKDIHPDYYEKFALLVAMLEETLKAIKSLRDSI